MSQLWSEGPEERRRPGRPKTIWRRMVEDKFQRKTAGWQSWVNVRTLAANHSGWKEKALRASWHGEIYTCRIGIPDKSKPCILQNNV